MTTWLMCITAMVAVAAEPAVEITVRPQEVIGPVSPYVFGAGIDAKTNPLRFPADVEQVERDIAESGLRIARYPGGFVFSRGDHRGSWANFYWQDHIGKNTDGRPTEVYDLDTFVQLCERHHIEPLMQINFVGEPIESVRGYIEYLTGDGDIDGDGVNWAARRAANGRQEPYAIKYWQLGNEVHSYPQGFHENAAGAKAYAAALDELVPIIRRMSPGSKVVVPFINIQRPISGMKSAPKDVDINFTTASEFSHAFLKHLRVQVDYFDWHSYAANGWNDSWPFMGTDDEWKHYYCWGTKFRQCYDAIGKLIDERCKLDQKPKIIVGEWSGDWTGAIFRSHKDSYRGSMMRTMASALFMGDGLIFLMQKSVPDERIHAAFWHAFCNDAQALFSIQTTREQGISYKGQSTDEGYGFRMPVYWVFKLLSEQRGDVLVASTLKGDNTIAAPPNGLYVDPPFAFERVTYCATVKDGKLFVALVNKDAHKAVDVTLRFDRWPAKPTYSTWTVSGGGGGGGGGYLAQNTIAQPDRVTLQGPTTGRGRRYRCPANSVVVLCFEEDRRENAAAR